MTNLTRRQQIEALEKVDKNTKCVLVNAANKVTLSTTDTSNCEKSIK